MEQASLIPNPDSGVALTSGGVMALLEKVALQHGEDTVAKMERLMDLAVKADAISAAKAFNAAFARFRAECPTIQKNAEGRVAGRDGGGFKWMYARYEDIRKVVDPILARHDLFLDEDSEQTDNEITGIVTLSHVAGHSRSSRFTVRRGGANTKMSPGQQDAGTLSLALRRALCMRLGVVTEEGDPNAPSGEAITEEQAIDLDTLLSQIPEPRQRGFLKWLRVERLSDVPASRFAEAREKLLAAIQKESGQ